MVDRNNLRPYPISLFQSYFSVTAIYASQHP